VPKSEWVTAPVAGAIKRAKWRIAADLVVDAAWVHASHSTPSLAAAETFRHHTGGDAQTESKPQQSIIQSAIDAAERVPKTRGRAAHLAPVRFIRETNLTKYDKLRLAYDALTLSCALGRQVAAGKIIHGDEPVTTNIKTIPLLRESRTIVQQILTMLAGNSPPDLVLNRHCSECEFETRCRQEATAKDDLSLLSNMKEGERAKYNSEGIFTVTLSGHVDGKSDFVTAVKNTITH